MPSEPIRHKNLTEKPQINQLDHKHKEMQSRFWYANPNDKDSYIPPPANPGSLGHTFQEFNVSTEPDAEGMSDHFKDVNEEGSLPDLIDILEIDNSDVDMDFEDNNGINNINVDGEDHGPTNERQATIEPGWLGHDIRCHPCPADKSCPGKENEAPTQV